MELVAELGRAVVPVLEVLALPVAGELVVPVLLDVSDIEYVPRRGDPPYLLL